METAPTDSTRLTQGASTTPDAPAATGSQAGQQNALAARDGAAQANPVQDEDAIADAYLEHWRDCLTKSGEVESANRVAIVQARLAHWRRRAGDNTYLIDFMVSVPYGPGATLGREIKVPARPGPNGWILTPEAHAQIARVREELLAEARAAGMTTH